MSTSPGNYQQIITGLKDRIRQARLKAAVLVNTELLRIYWEIGNTVLEQQRAEGWGAKVIERLATDLKTEFPDFKGLSLRNLKYMRSFAETWPSFGQAPLAQNYNVDNQSDAIVQAELAQLPWYHHITLLDKVKDQHQRIFYIRKALENGWSRDVMVHQIETGLFQRTGKAITNFKVTLPAIQSDLAQQAIKNPYVFDFISFAEEMRETELEKGLVQHMKKFMLELGKGFSWVGNQKSLVVEDDDFFLDLLFFNYHMNCFVVFELKVGEFKPEFAGKLNFYVNTIDEQLKLAHHNPTIGILLCKTPNETVVKYSLQGIESPIGVSSYQFEKALPPALQAELPTVEELEKEVEQGYDELKKPSERKLDTLKEMLKNLKEPEVKESKTPEIVQHFFEGPLTSLIQKMTKRYEPIAKWFQGNRLTIYIDSHGYPTIEDAAKDLRDKNRYAVQKFEISYDHNGFRKAGTKAFNCRSSISIQLRDYNYKISSGRTESTFIDRVYHQLPTNSEEDAAVESWFEELLDDIATQVKRLNPEA